MIALEAEQRHEVLETFQSAVSYLYYSMTFNTGLALEHCNNGDVDRALEAEARAIRAKLVLTVIKSYLESLYKQAVGLH